MTIRLKCLAPRPMAALRLILVPFAGGGVGAFHGWAAALPGGIEPYALQLPGREDRLSEPALTDWAEMQAQAIDALGGVPTLPIALFGHSLGAVIALELARALTKSRPGSLRHLFCAARPWPGAPTGERAGLSALSDDDLIAALDAQYGSLATSLSHPEIRALALPSLRGDLALLESYRWTARAPLPCPLTIYAGSADPITPAASLAAWQAETASDFAVVQFEGGHFFQETAREGMLGDMVARLLG